jgi:hypothetical protein
MELRNEKETDCMTHKQIEHLSRGYVLVESTTICDDEACSKDDNISMKIARFTHTGDVKPTITRDVIDGSAFNTLPCSRKMLEHLSRGYVFVDSLADYRDLERGVQRVPITTPIRPRHSYQQPAEDIDTNIISPDSNIISSGSSYSYRSSCSSTEIKDCAKILVGLHHDADEEFTGTSLGRNQSLGGHSITAGNDEKKRKEDAEKAAKNILKPLSDYEHNRVQHALYDRGPLEEKLATSATDSVQRKSIHTLRPKEWLNDEVIHYFYSMLAKRDEALSAANPGRKRSHFFKSFFFTKLFDEGATNEYKYSNVESWSKKVPGKDIFALDKICFACNILQTHWTCVVIFMQEKRIQFYDSMKGDGYHYSDGLLQYLKDEWAAKKGGELPDADKWRVVGAETGVPRQTNGYDCGVFTCMFADFLSLDRPLSFDQTHIDQCRHRIVLSILDGEVVIDGAGELAGEANGALDDSPSDTAGEVVIDGACELAGEADGALVASSSVTADNNDVQIISDGSEDGDFDNVSDENTSEDGNTENTSEVDENTSEDGNTENTSEVGDSDDDEYIGNDHEDANSDNTESSRINIPDLDNDPYWERENNSSTLVHPNNSPSSEHTVDHDADQDDHLVCMLRETYDKCYDIVASSIFLSCPDPPEASEIFANHEEFIKFFEDKFDLMIALMCAYYKGPEVNNMQELRACLENRDDLFPLVCHGTAYRKRGCPLKDFIETFDRHDFKFTHCRDSPYGCKIHPTPNLKMVNQEARRTVDAIKGVSGVKGVGGLIDSYDKEFRQTFRYWNDEFARKIQSIFSDPRHYIRAHFKESWDKQVSYIMFMLHVLQVNNEHHLQVRLFVMTGRWRTNKCYIESRIRFKIDLRIGQDGS